MLCVSIFAASSSEAWRRERAKSAARTGGAVASDDMKWGASCQRERVAAPRLSVLRGKSWWWWWCKRKERCGPPQAPPEKRGGGGAVAKKPHLPGETAHKERVLSLLFLNCLLAVC